MLGALPQLHCQDRVVASLASPAAEVRQAAIQLVVKYRIREAHPTLAAMLQSDPDPRVRAVTVDAVARLGRREAIPLLIQVLDDPTVTQTSPAVPVRSAVQFWLPALTGKNFATKAEWERWWQEEQARQRQGVER